MSEYQNKGIATYGTFWHSHTSGQSESYRGRISTFDISPAVLSPLGTTRRKVYPDAMDLLGFHIAGNAKEAQVSCGLCV